MPWRSTKEDIQGIAGLKNFKEESVRSCARLDTAAEQHGFIIIIIIIYGFIWSVHPGFWFCCLSLCMEQMVAPSNGCSLPLNNNKNRAVRVSADEVHIKRRSTSFDFYSWAQKDLLLGLLIFSFHVYHVLWCYAHTFVFYYLFSTHSFAYFSSFTIDSFKSFFQTLPSSLRLYLFNYHTRQMGIWTKISDASALLRAKWMMSHLSANLSTDESDLRFCYDSLQEVSRSFAVVIMQLTDRDLRDSLCIFYLVLRALDTVEDDMALDLGVKIKELQVFHTHLGDATWHLTGIGKARELEVLEQFPRVSREFNKLKEAYQTVIRDITQKMAMGMIDFLKRPVVTVADYDLYCHYVAGLVGHGITRLFAHCGFENPKIADDLAVANEMGLFLQKTNIIRDYFEDIREEIWGKYAAELKDFADRANEKKAVACINHMVVNALSHLPSVITYMMALQDPSVMRFCGIPQIMAIGTLCEVYNNPNTFHVKVKISKVSACHVMLETNTTHQFLRGFRVFAVKFLHKLDPKDPFTPTARQQLESTIVRIDDLLQQPERTVQPLHESSSLVLRLIMSPYNLVLWESAGCSSLLWSHVCHQPTPICLHAPTHPPPIASWLVLFLILLFPIVCLKLFICSDFCGGCRLSRLDGHPVDIDFHWLLATGPFGALTASALSRATKEEDSARGWYGAQRFDQGADPPSSSSTNLKKTYSIFVCLQPVHDKRHSLPGDGGGRKTGKDALQSLFSLNSALLPFSFSFYVAEIFELTAPLTRIFSRSSSLSRDGLHPSSRVHRGSLNRFKQDFPEIEDCAPSESPDVDAEQLARGIASAAVDQYSTYTNRHAGADGSDAFQLSHVVGLARRNLVHTATVFASIIGPVYATLALVFPSSMGMAWDSASWIRDVSVAVGLAIVLLFTARTIVVNRMREVTRAGWISLMWFRLDFMLILGIIALFGLRMVPVGICMTTVGLYLAHRMALLEKRLSSQQTDTQLLPEDTSDMRYDSKLVSFLIVKRQSSGSSRAFQPSSHVYGMDSFADEPLILPWSSPLGWCEGAFVLTQQCISSLFILSLRVSVGIVAAGYATHRIIPLS
eukprot:gene1693-1055_t